MKKIKIFLCFLFIISLTGIASAETINYDYTTSTEKIYKNVPIGVFTPSAKDMQSLVTNDVTLLEVTEVIIVNIPSFVLKGEHKDEITLEFPIDFKIGNKIVGSGTYQRTTSKNKNGVLKSVVVTIVINNFDAKGYINKQYIKMIPKGNATIDDFVFAYGNIYHQPENLDDGLGIFLCAYDTCTPSNSITYNRLAVDFHQVLEYHITENAINLNFFRHEINNFIEVKYGEQTILSELKNTDIFTTSYFKPLKISVQNPYTLTFWNNIIPEDLEITGKTKVTYKLVDTTQPYITLRGVYQIWEYHPDTDTFTDYDIGNINGETDIYFDTGKTYSIEFTNNDYKPFKIDYHKKIESVSKNNVIEMEKDEGDNITVSFRAENMDYGKSDNKYPHQYFRDFSISKNGETKYSNNAGYIFYENITPQEFNIIAKTAGYDDYHKNYGVLDKTQLITIPLKSEGNYKFLSLKAYNGNNPSQTVATNYKIYVTKNGIETLLIETEAMQGAFVYYLEVGFLHRVEYSSYGFKSGEIVYNPFFMDVVEKIYLYPEEEGINTLIFEIVDSKNIPSYGVRVAIGEEIKYTDTNGKTSFALPQGPVTYEIYKQGYQKIGNSFDLTEDYLLKITLLKDGEAPPSTTPEIPPTEVKPSNIIESVKYAFSKMFGFNYNNPEDITKNNLLFGLIIVLGVATVVAGVTKDGLGALVGGVIGFVFSSALGLIPIWVLLTGFAFIAIYIILFRISNDGGN